MLQSKMTVVRHDSPQQNECCQRWIKSFVVAILAALLLFVAFNLHSDVDESRKLLKGLSGRLAKIEKENENLRSELKELRHAKAKTILQVVSDMQKGSRARRSHKAGHDDTKCKKWHHCFHKGFNCSMIKDCIPKVPSRGKDYIHVFVLGPLSTGSLPTGSRRVTLPWQKYIPDNSDISLLRTDIWIEKGGLYFVYCRLAVSKFISKVYIWEEDTVSSKKTLLFTSLPTFSNGSGHGVVQIFGLAELHRSKESLLKLYVQVEFFNESEVRKYLNGKAEGMAKLFPGFNKDVPYNSSSHRVPDRNINSFGVFMVSSKEE